MKTSSYAHVSGSHPDQTFTLQLTLPFSAQKPSKAAIAQPQPLVGEKHPSANGQIQFTRTLTTDMLLTVNKSTKLHVSSNF